MPAAHCVTGTPRMTPCPLCGGTLRPRPITLRDRLGLTDSTFGLDACDQCGHAVLSPRPDAPAYPPAHWPSGGLQARYRRWLIARDLDRLFRHAAPGRLLDVGSGAGTVLELARERGWTVTGVEVAPEALAYSRARGLDVRTGPALPDESFDAVTLFHVLEHVPDPVATLATVRDRLAPGGLLISQVPNAGGLQARLFKDRWYGWDAPRHLHHFTPTSLLRAVEAAGLELVATDQQSLRHAPVSLVSSLLPGLSAHGFATGQSPGFAKPLYLALTWLLAPWAWLEGVLGAGAVVTVVARKPR